MRAREKTSKIKIEEGSTIRKVNWKYRKKCSKNEIANSFFYVLQETTMLGCEKTKEEVRIKWEKEDYGEKKNDMKNN